MARNLDPKCKQCRQAGEKLFLKGERCFTPKCSMVRRNYPPGQHGQQRKRRVSSFGTQLLAKQKARRIYRILEKQLRTYYEKAIKERGNTGQRIVQLLEMRLDNVLFRLGFSNSRDQARQLITHGHIQINGKRLNIPSYQVRLGDKLSINPGRRAKISWQDMAKLVEKRPAPPGWLSRDVAKLEGQVDRMPEGDELNIGISTPQIVEYYSR